MATRPGVLLFGDHRGFNGGTTPITRIVETVVGGTTLGTVESSLQWNMDLHQIIPAGTDNEPDAAVLSWWPWFDGMQGGLETNSGTPYVIASVTSTTATITGAGWTVDEWIGYEITNNNASGYGWHNQAVVVVSNTADTVTVAAWTGGTPDVGEGLWFNEGRFGDYHVAGGWRSLLEFVGSAVQVRGGSTWQNSNNGLGYDAGLVRELFTRVYPADPYFQCFKWTPTDAKVKDYATAGASRTAFETKLARVNVCATQRYSPDTISWDYCVFDMAQGDVHDWIANPGNEAGYLANLQATLTWLRSAAVCNNANMRVLLINHDHVLRNVDAAGKTAAASTYQTAAAILDANTRIVEFNGQDFPTKGTALSATLWLATEDREGYHVDTYASRAPALISKHIELWEAGAAPAADGALPMYILLGDSIEVGSMTSTYTTALVSGSLTGSVRDARQKIWNRSTQAVEAYTPHTNSQTSGSTLFGAIAGPEFSLMQELMIRHPDTGFVIVKRASVGAGLAAEANAYDANDNGGTWASTVDSEHWDELATDIAGATQYVNTVLGKQVELMAIHVGLGSNDSAVSGGGAIFATELPQFVAQLRDAYGTHNTGKATPILWRKPQLGVGVAIRTEMVAIRAALTSLAKTDKQFRLVDVDDLERQVDNIHETPETTIERGRRINAQLNFVELPNC
tara:strand:- start:32764 stop:34812 length:2049 start_codon:yes stop_codon:yes gene_type:complete